MNTKDDWQTVAIALDEERARIFVKVFGKNEAPIQGIVPEMAMVTGEEQAVYLLDMAALTDEQIWQLAKHIADEFGFQMELVLVELMIHGCPVLAEMTTVRSTDFSMMQEDLPLHRQDLPRTFPRPLPKGKGEGGRGSSDNEA